LDRLFQFTSYYGKIMALYVRSVQLSQTTKPAFLKNNLTFLARGKVRNVSRDLVHLLADLHPLCNFFANLGGERGEIGDGLGKKKFQRDAIFRKVL